MDAYWRAANYLSVGQIYLLDNPLLKEPLRREHVKPRLLGHWGTTPGLNFIYVHLNRVIKEHDLSVLYVAGPGHGGPGAGGQRVPGGDLQRGLPEYLAGRGGDEAAVQAIQLPRRHPQPRRPGDAGLDPRGGRARATPSRTPTAPRSTTPTCSSPAWSATARPRPARSPRAGTRTSSSTRPRDGAVLPILHLNGYKIANPCFLARIPEDELGSSLEGYGYAPHFVEGHEPERGPPGDGRRPGRLRRRDQADPGGGPARRRPAPARAGR